jgi:hypothetical protein
MAGGIAGRGRDVFASPVRAAELAAALRMLARMVRSLNRHLREEVVREDR